MNIGQHQAEARFLKENIGKVNLPRRFRLDLSLTDPTDGSDLWRVWQIVAEFSRRNFELAVSRTHYSDYGL